MFNFSCSKEFIYPNSKKMSKQIIKLVVARERIILNSAISPTVPSCKIKTAGAIELGRAMYKNVLQRNAFGGRLGKKIFHIGMGINLC